jgi:hypothetical protein
MRQKVQPLPWLLFPAIIVALTGSLWAAFGDEGCTECSRSAALLGGLNLGAIGAGYYGLLLLMALASRLSPSTAAAAAGSRCARGGMLIAGGVHLTLLALLIRHRIVCPPCLLTAAGALAGAAAALALDRHHRLRAAALLLAAGVVTYAGTRVLQQSAGTRYALQALRAERVLLGEQALPPSGRARMVVYQRPTCPVCRQFKAQVVAPLRNEFRSKLAVEERLAWKGMPTPIVIILGRKNARLVGYHPREEVRRAVLLAVGSQASL